MIIPRELLPDHCMSLAEQPQLDGIMKVPVILELLLIYDEIDTASEGDFRENATTLIFTLGQTTATFVIETVDDAFVEATETFRVELSNPTGGAQIRDGIRDQVEDGTVFDGELPTLMSKEVTSIIKSYKKSFGLLPVIIPLDKYLFGIFSVGL